MEKREKTGKRTENGKNSRRRKKKVWQKGLCAVLAVFVMGVYSPTAFATEGGSAAEAHEEESEKMLAPYFVVRNGDEEGGYFPLKETDVKTTVNGMIAETYVTQTYVNEGDVPINARYVFPASSAVAVHGMKMTIGNQVVMAQIKEKEEAKAEYETAKSEGKSASLLEQKRPNVFTMDVANIMPEDTVSIELHYTELITPVEGEYAFVFPTVVGPRYTGSAGEDMGDAGAGDESWTASPYLPEGEVPEGRYDISVHLSTGVPIAEVSCKSHEIKVEKREESDVEITLAHPEEYAGNRDFILKYKLAGEDVCSGLVLAGDGEENYFMLTVQPPEHYEPEEIPPREYIFVLDVSGSMMGYPLDTAKSLIRDLVTDLRDTDKFNLVLFADSVMVMSEESLAAMPENILTAMELIEEQKGGGGTSMMPALEAAAAVPRDGGTARSIVVVTDGYVSNDREILDFVDQNMDSAGFFSFGIGSSVNDYLIRGIAGAGMGEAFIVTDSQDAAESADSFRTYIEAPLLTGITIDYDGFDVYDVEPSVPSVLYARRPIVLFGKWKGEPSGTVRISGKTGTRDYVQEISAEGTEIDTQGEAVRYLWARTRLDRLAGYGSVRNDASVKEDITRIGLDYSMTTPYTSFVAVVDVVRNPEGEGRDVEQALPLPLHVTGLAVGGGYTAYSEPGLLLMAVLGGALCAGIRRRRSAARAGRPGPGTDGEQQRGAAYGEAK